MSDTKTPITDSLQQIKFEGCDCLVIAPEDMAEIEIKLAAANERAESYKQVAEELGKAITPFTHHDLCEQLGGNSQGDDSPVFGRNKAILKLGYFRIATESLAKLEALNQGK